MKPHHREFLSSGLLLALLLITTGWSYTHYAGAKRAAALATADLAQSQRYAADIERFRQRPALAASEDARLEELAALVESAASSAAIPPEALVRVWPEQARRLGDSAYQEKPTQVLLRGVTLRQLTTFLHAATAEDTGLGVKAVRLVAPRNPRDAQDEAGDRWTAEATLTHLIYSPRSAPGSPGTPGSGATPSGGLP